jgi:hypothetical protein
MRLEYANGTEVYAWLVPVILLKIGCLFSNHTILATSRLAAALRERQLPKMDNAGIFNILQGL